MLMVEHDEDCIRAADYMIDIGAGCGSGMAEHVVCTLGTRAGSVRQYAERDD